MNSIKQTGRALTALRDRLWMYPDWLLWSDNSIIKGLSVFYRSTRPFSHIVVSIFLYTILTFGLITSPQALLSLNNTDFIEASIVGVDEKGSMRGLTRINPLIPSTSQLEIDISNLVYDNLYTLDQQGNVIPKLIESYEEKSKDNYYSFKLRKGVKWHDGVAFSSRDVKATLGLLIELNRNPDTASSFSNVAANQLAEIFIIDDLNFEVMLKDRNTVLPTLLESLTFKILPAHLIEDLNAENILTAKPRINSYPIGTGPFKNLSHSLSGNSYKLIRNDSYFLGASDLGSITFQLFPDEASAILALQTSRIHAIGGLSSKSLDQVREFKNYKSYISSTIYNQYWALHFNLDPNSGNPLLASKYLRQAIGKAINKQKLIEVLGGQAEVASGTIPEISSAYNFSLKRNEYNPVSALQLFEKEGWIQDQNTGILTKDGQSFEFELAFLNSPDRMKVAEQIKSDLEVVGVQVHLKPLDILTLNTSYLLTNNFDVILYGQTTFIDDDRYELYHSSQAKSKLFDPSETSYSTGLNISNYSSEAKDIKIVNQESVEVPKVDSLLEEIRAITDKDKRKEKIVELQAILEDEMPTIVLYHPKYTYVVSLRVSGIDLGSINSLAGRFDSITRWEIE